MNKLKYRKDK